MKKTVLSICMIIIAVLTVNAQVPSGIKYQAVARNANSGVMANQDVKVEIIIDKGQSPAQEVFSETYYTTTNEFGLISLVIGEKNAAEFAAINWAAGEYFISVKINDNLMGTSQVLSVPYALQAKAAETYNETDPKWTAAATNYYTKTNMQTSGSAQLHWGNLTSKPTTLSGYGITDGVTLGTTQSITGTKTFTKKLHLVIQVLMLLYLMTILELIHINC